MCLFCVIVLHLMEAGTKPSSPISRDEWRIIMRKNFCRKDMIDEDGNLVKESIALCSTNRLDTSI